MDALRCLRSLVVTAHAKIHKNRFKDRTVVGKWEVQAHDEEGGRTWKNASKGFLFEKLREEVKELADASAIRRPILADVREEAGDVCAIAMMVADNQGALMTVPKVVCLCGSTKFRKEFEQANFDETMKGNIVLSVGFFAHADKERHVLLPEEKIMLDDLHKDKIDLADEILVINVGGYVGESTESEIEYAIATGKGIRYLESR